MSRSTNRLFRKRLLIYPRFQLALLSVNLGVLIAFFLSVRLAVSRSYDYLKSEGSTIGLSANHSYFKFIELQARLVYHSMDLALAIGLAISIVVVLLLSNWLVGPIVRLRDFFDDVSKGKPTAPLSFRKRDFFPDLPRLVNSALERTKKR